MMNLDTSYSQSTPLLLKSWQKLKIILVGCGGTGSAVASSIARIAYVLQEMGKEVAIIFVDFDVVELHNIPRQNFCRAEIGLPKAQTLALRYSAAWGVDISAISDRFYPELADSRYEQLTVIVGAVDNAEARRSISGALDNNRDNSSVWWLDAGNSFSSGQVLLGCTNNPDVVAQYAFNSSNLASVLPSPSLVHPELLIPLPESDSSSKLSCAEIVMMNAQSLMVNQRIAVEVGDYLLRLLISKNLRRFATYFDLATGTAHSKYICSQAIDVYKYKLKG
ncbi:MAG TPA: ThiF family adenylyltransferase [Oculatellaceae cyanobacterium]|jgi:PRTRC genetic system ThiF family protein